MERRRGTSASAPPMPRQGGVAFHDDFSAVKRAAAGVWRTAPAEARVRLHVLQNPCQRCTREYLGSVGLLEVGAPSRSCAGYSTTNCASASNMSVINTTPTSWRADLALNSVYARARVAHVTGPARFSPIPAGRSREREPVVVLHLRRQTDRVVPIEPHGGPFMPGTALASASRAVSRCERCGRGAEYRPCQCRSQRSWRPP